MVGCKRASCGASNAAVLGGFAIVGVAIVLAVVLSKKGGTKTGDDDSGPRKKQSEQAEEKRLNRKTEYQAWVKVEGELKNEDWGVREYAHYVYLTSGKWTSLVQKDNGVLVETRKYEYAGAKVVISKAKIELNDGWYAFLMFCDPSFTTAAVVAGAQAGVNKALEEGYQMPDQDFHVRGKTYKIRYVKEGAPAVTCDDGTPPTGDELDTVLCFPVSIDQDVKGKDEITVDGSTVAALIFDPKLKATSTGSFAARKTGSQGNRDTWGFSGRVALVSRDDKNETQGELRLGSVSLLVEDGFLLRGQGKGKASYSITSTNHLLFKASQSYEPDIEAELTAKVVE